MCLRFENANSSRKKAFVDHFLHYSLYRTGFFEEPDFQIRSKNTLGPTVIRQFLGKQKNLLLVWTDSINVSMKASNTL